MNKSTRFALLYLLITVSGLFLVNGWWDRSRTVAVIPYSLFQQLVEQVDVQEVVVGQRVPTPLSVANSVHAAHA